MSNMWSLWEDYEKRYNTWLKNSAVPATQSWYEGTGLEEKLQTGKEYLWGQTGTAPMGPESEGTQGLLGVKGQEPSFRGLQQSRTGQAISGISETDYFTRPTVRTKHPTEGVIKGQKLMSPADRDVSAVGKKTIDVLADIVHWGVDKLNSVHDQMFPNANKNISSNAKRKMISDKMKTLPAQLGGLSTEEQAKQFTDQDASSLAKFAGVNLKDVAKKFQKQGGFEGLMANPAFTLGLALMQSSAQGKTIGSGVLDNFVKAAGLSDHYKDRIQARKDRLEAKGEVIGPPSEAEMGVVERVLESKKFKTYTGFTVGSFLSKHLFGKDKEAQYHSTVSAIAAKVNAKSAAEAAKGKKVQITEDYVLSVVNEMIKKGELKKGEGITEGVLAGKIFEMRPELTTRAEGGPVQAGQPYVVGEQGPEVVVPKANANVVSNDDSQIMGMLLASNPQLQNVSKTRAESILRSRFPDYFA